MSNVTSNIPDYSIPFINKDGQMNEVWWRFLITLFNRSGGSAGGDISKLTIIVTQQGVQISALEAEESDKIVPINTWSASIEELRGDLAGLRIDRDSLRSIIEEIIGAMPGQQAVFEVRTRVDDLELQIAGQPYGSALSPALPSNAVGNFYAYKTATQTFVATTVVAVNFDTKLFDDLAEFNTSTGIFTPAADGFYVFSGGIEGTQTSVARRIIGVLVNGTERVRLQDTTGNSGACAICGASPPIKLKAGDAVRLFYYTGIADTTTATQQTDFFGGYRIK